MQSQPLHHRAYHHVRKHKKRYVRFIVFFLFLVSYSLIEDMATVTLTGVEFDMIVLMTVIALSIAFTFIAEVTEAIVVKEKPRIKRIIKREEKIIEKEEHKIEKRLRKM